MEFLAIKKFLMRYPSTRRLLGVKLIRNIIKTIRFVLNLQLVQGPLTYNQDGLATRHNSDFMKDPLFIESYRRGQATCKGSGSFYEESKIQWRIYILCWAATVVKHLEGDFVECGVNRGWFSRAVMHYIDFAHMKKTFYLLDTFSGFSDKYTTDEEKELGRVPGKEGGYDECYESVKNTFKDFSNVRIVKGPIPDTLPAVNTEKVCYLSIDMNCVLPEIAAAEYFWPKLVKGGIIVLDDYGWKTHLKQKEAFDQFARQRGVEILSLPTGQGLILKSW